MVHNHLKKAKKRQARYAYRNAKYIEFQVGDLVYVKKRKRSSKLEGKWLPYYRILEKRTPVIIENTVDKSTEKVHAEHLHFENLKWEIPKGKNLSRKARYVIIPEIQMTALVTQNQITDLHYIRLQTRITMKGKDLQMKMTYP